MKKLTKKKRYILGKGYPWYSDTLATLTFYKHRNTFEEKVMLDPKGTHNGKKYKIVLEEI